MSAISFAHAWASTPERLAVAAAVTVCFALLARGARGVSRSVALAGGLACFALFAGAGPGAFATLAALFAATWIGTRLGYRRKLELGLAERREGRNAGQVLANLVVAAAAALIFGVTGNEVWIMALVAALVEAATDTVASEIGQSRRRDAWMITSGARVPAGTDGGITFFGTAAGLAAGLAIAGLACVCGLVARRLIWIPVAAGFVGMLADSLMGATIQRRGWIGNRGVNFWGTLIAAAMAYGIVMTMG
ncbi:MAG: DUF92 domain-containing protein [Terriglobales bacterium]